jgi:hypothetical protein
MKPAYVAMLIEYIKEDLESVTTAGWCICDLDEDGDKLDFLREHDMLIVNPNDPRLVKIESQSDKA